MNAQLAESRSASPPLIAVVDDEASVRKALGRLLRAAGFDARPFASGREFLASCRVEPPECVVLDMSFKLDATIVGLAILYRVASVQQQVQQHLLELYAVAKNFGQLLRHRRVERHLMAGEAAAHEALHFFQERAHRHGLLDGVLLFQQRAKPADELTRALIFRDDVGEDLAYFGEIDVIARKRMLGRLRIAQNGSERLVQLMRHPARQLANYGDTRKVREPLLFARPFVIAPIAAPLRHDCGDQPGLDQYGRTDDRHRGAHALAAFPGYLMEPGLRIILRISARCSSSAEI